MFRKMKMSVDVRRGLTGFVAAVSIGSSMLTFLPSAQATFFIELPPSGTELKLDHAKDVSSFTGEVNGNLIYGSASGNVNTSSGNATIKPAKDETLTTLTFTPADPSLFSAFSFRGQLDEAAGGELTVYVQDNQGSAIQTFTFTGLGANADFKRIGIRSTDGETIQSVTIESVFKEQKQTEFTAVPEPGSLLAGVLLLIPLGFAVVCRRERG